ncbi:hypothetical protein ACVXG7_10095 [Enterobacter hormaechei]
MSRGDANTSFLFRTGAWRWKILRAFLDSRCHFWRCPAISVGDLVQVTWRRVASFASCAHSSVVAALRQRCSYRLLIGVSG